MFFTLTTGRRFHPAYIHVEIELSIEPQIIEKFVIYKFSQNFGIIHEVEQLFKPCHISQSCELYRVKGF